jgi:outer membrane cobalamin receptor
MRKMLQKFTLIAVMALFTGSLFAQGIVTGKIKDDMTGEPLIGATVVIDGTTTGATTDLDGVFKLDVPNGTQKLKISYVGFENIVVDVNVNNGETTNLGKVILKAKAIGLEGLSIIADRAKERETPVAISNVGKKELEENLGSRDLPMVMNNTPSVYATPQGGGAGDARINIRGFNQNNVAIMINGVPINDMENGWVYWSNWDGLGDAASSIQAQRGMSSINLATPSVGGTLNVLTDPAGQKMGGMAKFEVGSGQFFKTTLSGNTGMINNKFAVSATMVKKWGNGVVDKTWTDAYAYYLGAAYNVNENHRLELYVVGATQRHGQNLYKQNVAAYDSAYAKELGVVDEAITKFHQSDRGRFYNENWNKVSTSYQADQAWNGKTGRTRYADDYINERENYFHKPLANLNWYAQWTKKLTHFTTFYYSGGKGGGTGTYGKMVYDRTSQPSQIVDWDKTIAQNQDPTSSKRGVLRNSVNNQWTIGAISKVKLDITENFRMQAGIDWRTAKIDHYYEIRDLLGLTSFTFSGNEFDTEAQHQKGIGDKVNYFNTNTVDWIGGFLQGEYVTEKFTAYGTAGYSTIKYHFTDHFHTAAKKQDGVDALGNPFMVPDVNSGELKSNTDWIGGYQLKGGANFNLTEALSVYANFGLISKVPIFDAVIDDGDGTVAIDPKNEKFTAFEAGALYSTINDKFKVALNYYYTNWSDRTFTTSIQTTPDVYGIAFIKGVNQLHTGLELEFNFRPITYVGIGGAASFAKWKYLNDVSAQVKTYDSGVQTNDTINLYIADLYVGDAPQIQFTGWLDIFPVKGLKLQLIMRHNSNHYAQFNPTSRTDETDKAQVWETPSYSVFDAHANYQLPLKGKLGINVFVHVFNIFDTFYIQDAVDNSRYNGYYGDNNKYSHTVNSAEVFLGLPFNFNLGVKVTI